MAAATADRVAAYAAELGARLEVERTADQAENARLLATCSPKELQRQGILLTPLNVASVSTGLGGRRYACQACQVGPWGRAGGQPGVGPGVGPGVPELRQAFGQLRDVGLPPLTPRPCRPQPVDLAAPDPSTLPPRPVDLLPPRPLDLAAPDPLTR